MTRELGYLFYARIKLCWSPGAWGCGPTMYLTELGSSQAVPAYCWFLWYQLELAGKARILVGPAGRSNLGLLTLSWSGLCRWLGSEGLGGRIGGQWHSSGDPYPEADSRPTFRHLQHSSSGSSRAPLSRPWLCANVEGTVVWAKPGQEGPWTDNASWLEAPARGPMSHILPGQPWPAT